MVYPSILGRFEIVETMFEDRFKGGNSLILGLICIFILCIGS
jgi:hypothetical protein